MPISTVATPQMERVRQLVEEAQNSTDGVDVLLRVEKYGSLAACKTAARGLQVSFSNLRVRARRMAMRLKGETTEYLAGMTKGEYDNIACVVRPLPKEQGYKVSFVPAYALDRDLEVVDRATGQPVANEDPEVNRFLQIMGKVLKEDTQATFQRRAAHNVLSLEELQFLWAHDAEECQRLGIPPLPSVIRDDPRDYASVDLADLDEDELEIVNPSREE